MCFPLAVLAQGFLSGSFSLSAFRVFPDLEPLVSDSIEHNTLVSADIAHHACNPVVVKTQFGDAMVVCVEPRQLTVEFLVVLQECSVKLLPFQQCTLMVGCIDKPTVALLEGVVFG